MHFSLSYSPIPELPATAPPPACSRQSASGSSACGRTVDKRFAYRTYWTGPESWSGPEENCLESERWTVLCDARIDGKASLIRALSCGDVRRERDLSRANTANLILAAFLKWGASLVDHVLGDYAFVIYDAETGKVRFGTSPLGLRTLYISQNEQDVRLSSELSPLIPKHPSLSEVDEFAIAGFLLVGYHAAIDHERTPYKSISQVAAGSFNTIAGRELTRDHTWSFPESSTALRLPRLHDYCEHFREVLANAVSDRVRDRRVAIALSGGLDSTAVAGLCSDAASAGGGPTAVSAFTFIADGDDDEALFASEVAKRLGYPHEVFDYSQATPLGAISRSTVPSLDLFPEFGNLARSITAQHSDVVLYGHGGDNVLCSGNPNVLATARRYGLRIAAEAASLLYFRHGLRPSLGTGLFQRVRFPSGGKSTKAADAARPELPKWISKEFVARLRLVDYWEDFLDRKSWSSNQPFGHVRSSLMWHPWVLQMDSADVLQILPSATDPFLDLRVIEARLSYPELGLMHKKHLLREAMRGRLPDAVLNRPKTPAANLLRGHGGKAEVHQSLILKRPADIANYVNLDRYHEAAKQYDRLQPKEWVQPLMLDRWLFGLSLPWV